MGCVGRIVIAWGVAIRPGTGLSQAVRLARNCSDVIVQDGAGYLIPNRFLLRNADEALTFTGNA